MIRPEDGKNNDRGPGVDHPWQFRLTSRLLFDWNYVPFGGVKLIGADNVPTETGAYVSPDHESLLDIPLYDRALWKATHQTSYYVGRQNLLRPFPVIGTAFGEHLMRIGIVPVNRDVPLAEQPEFVTYLDEIAARRNRVVWHPEGTRTKHPEHEIKIRNLHPGIGLMAVRHGLPIVPASAKREGRKVVIFEEPVEVEQADFDIYDVRELASVRKEIVRPAMKRVHEGMQRARLRAYGIQP